VLLHDYVAQNNTSQLLKLKPRKWKRRPMFWNFLFVRYRTYYTVECFAILPKPDVGRKQALGTWDSVRCKIRSLRRGDDQPRGCRIKSIGWMYNRVQCVWGSSTLFGTPECSSRKRLDQFLHERERKIPRAENSTRVCLLDILARLEISSKAPNAGQI
jgi:hypothetical protein